MIKEVAVVIGANYGDEGKGYTTQQFCNKFIESGLNPIVVCHNGGAQRGHTVIHKGVRHVFRHFGSGSSCGCPTYLSEDFILNPIIFREEYEKLSAKGIDLNGKVYVNSNCLVTTPFEMFLNDMKERKRNKNRHGSCGLGIYETIQRNKEIEFKVSTLDETSNFLDEISKIIKYFNKQVDMEDLSSYKKDYMNEDGLKAIVTNYYIDFAWMLNRIKIINPDNEKEFLESFDSLVFEGGQGLLLDKNNREGFPHLTPSNTGSDNPIKILKKLDLFEAELEVCYVTRSYLTRHGAGYLENECQKEDFDLITFDKTNVPNEFQGTLRYGKLNFDTLISRTNKDYAKWNDANLGIDYFNQCKSYMITHLNEYDLETRYLYKDKEMSGLHESCDEKERSM